MRRDQVYSIIGLLMLACAVIGSRAVSKIAIPTPHLLPIDRMTPDRVGNWQLAKQLPIDPEIREILISAKILDSTYVNSSGSRIELMLVTASSRDDIHDPRVCFPAQGWRLTNGRPIRLADQIVETMTATQGPLRTDILYWMTGYFPPSTPTNPLLRWITKSRNRLVGTQEGMSLFVRLGTEDSDHARGDLADFAQHLMPSVAAMKATVPPNRR